MGGAGAGGADPLESRFAFEVAAVTAARSLSRRERVGVRGLGNLDRAYALTPRTSCADLSPRER